MTSSPPPHATAMLGPQLPPLPLSRTSTTRFGLTLRPPLLTWVSVSRLAATPHLQGDLGGRIAVAEHRLDNGIRVPIAFAAAASQLCAALLRPGTAADLG